MDNEQVKKAEALSRALSAFLADPACEQYTGYAIGGAILNLAPTRRFYVAQKFTTTFVTMLLQVLADVHEAEGDSKNRTIGGLTMMLFGNGKFFDTYVQNHVDVPTVIDELGRNNCGLAAPLIERINKSITKKKKEDAAKCQPKKKTTPRKK